MPLQITKEQDKMEELRNIGKASQIRGKKKKTLSFLKKRMDDQGGGEKEGRKVFQMVLKCVQHRRRFSNVMWFSEETKTGLHC